MYYAQMTDTGKTKHERPGQIPEALHVAKTHTIPGKG
jgi:hypothetical protein